MSSLRILVPVKRVIDYAVGFSYSHPSRSREVLDWKRKLTLKSHTDRVNNQVKPRVNKANTAIETAGVKHSMNPFDELSIEEAVRLRERKTKPVADILAFSAGPAKAQDVLRTAMAMGADRALHVVVEADAGATKESADTGDLEPLGVAKLLAKVARDEERNLVILGKQSIDDDANQTGQMLAGLLGWPQATQASKVEVAADGDHVTVTREVDGGVETLRAPLPLVVTTDLRLNEPRYASLPNIMKAKKKPLVRKTLEEMGVDVRRRLRTVRVEEPPPRKGGEKVENVDGMIGRLKELGAI